MASAAEGSVAHAYGLVGAGVSLSLPQGIDGSPVTLLEVGEVAVLAGELSADRYGAEEWRAHAEDPRWLEHVAREHHAVLQAAVEQTEVLPLRLPGIHDDLATLRRVVEEQRPALEAALDAVRGHVEMGAKIFLVGEAAPPTAQDRPTSGRDYLARRSAEAGNREKARLRRQTQVLDAHEALAHASTRSAVNAPQDAALSGRSEPMLLNAAYLVPRGELDGFVAEADRLNQDLVAEGMGLEVSGPWPPYNFAHLPDESAVGRRR